MLIFFLLAVLLFGACHKNSTVNPLQSGAATGLKVDVPPIPNALIANWFAKNPAGAYFNVDWSKTEQTVIGGVAVVKAPLLSIANVSSQNGLKVQSLKALSDSTTHVVFNRKHPPAIYFFKNPAKKDSVTAVLMNFVPDDPAKDNGENRIWTGKLYEWDMQSVTSHYQVLRKSYVTAKGNFQIGQQNSNSLSSKIKTNSIWDFFSTYGMVYFPF